MNKIYLSGIVGVVILTLLFSMIFLNLTNQTDCNEFGVIYLKPSELSQASEISDNFNSIVSIPELDKIVGSAELLKCDFDFTEFIRGFN